MGRDGKDPTILGHDYRDPSGVLVLLPVGATRQVLSWVLRVTDKTTSVVLPGLPRPVLHETVPDVSPVSPHPTFDTDGSRCQLVSSPGRRVGSGRDPITLGRDQDPRTEVGVGLCPYVTGSGFLSSFSRPYWVWTGTSPSPVGTIPIGLCVHDLSTI